MNNKTTTKTTPAATTAIATTAKENADRVGITRATPDELRRDGFEYVRDVALEEGETLRGKLIGPGTAAEIQDPANGEIREVATWLVRSGSVTYRVLGSAMLDRLLRDAQKSHAGAIEVSITRGGQLDTRRGRRMTDWAVGVRLLPGEPA